MDLKGQGYIDLKEFVHGFFKIYFSNLDTKLKLIFDMYVQAFDYTLFLGMILTKMDLLSRMMWRWSYRTSPLPTQSQATLPRKVPSLKQVVAVKCSWTESRLKMKSSS